MNVLLCLGVDGDSVCEGVAEALRVLGRVERLEVSVVDFVVIDAAHKRYQVIRHFLELDLLIKDRVDHLVVLALLVHNLSTIINLLNQRLLANLHLSNQAPRF